MKNQSTHLQDLKNELQYLTVNRQSVERGRDISGSMVKISDTLQNIKPLMDKQTHYIKNFLQVQSSQGEHSKQLQARRYANRIYEISYTDFNDLLNASQDYFSLDHKESWNKIRTNVEKQLNNLRDKAQQQGNSSQFLFSIMNARDKLLGNFFKSMIYKICLICKDLNLNTGGFIHGEKKAIIQLIEQYKQSCKYVPTKPFFEQLDFDKRGNWSLHKSDGSSISIGGALKIVDQQLQQLLNIVRNYANLNQQQRKHEDITRNSNVVKSLRKQIEDVYMSYSILEKKYRDALSKDEKMDAVEMREKLRQCEENLQAKQQQLKKLKEQFRDSAQQINGFKQKIKAQEDDLDRIQNSEMVKLKQVQLVQFTLRNQLSLISKKIVEVGKMFEFESQGKRSLGRQINGLKQKMQNLATLLGKQKNANRDLQTQIVRLNQVIIQAGKKIKQLLKQNQSLAERLNRAPQRKIQSKPSQYSEAEMD